MHITKYKICIVDGCGRPSHGKAYCGTHLKNRKSDVVITSAMRIHMRSNCCDALCVSGAKHEYGAQYCKKCGLGCVWKSPMRVGREE